MSTPEYIVTLRLSPQAFNDHCTCDRADESDDHEVDCKREYQECTLRIPVGGGGFIENGPEEGVGFDVLAVEEAKEGEKSIEATYQEAFDKSMKAALGRFTAT